LIIAAIGVTALIVLAGILARLLANGGDADNEVFDPESGEMVRLDSPRARGGAERIIRMVAFSLVRGETIRAAALLDTATSLLPEGVDPPAEIAEAEKVVAALARARQAFEAAYREEIGKHIELTVRGVDGTERPVALTVREVTRDEIVGVTPEGEVRTVEFVRLGAEERARRLRSASADPNVRALVAGLAYLQVRKPGDARQEFESVDSPLAKALLDVLDTASPTTAGGMRFGPGAGGTGRAPRRRTPGTRQPPGGHPPGGDR
jgi:hypothetical protein